MFHMLKNYLKIHYSNMVILKLNCLQNGQHANRNSMTNKVPTTIPVLQSHCT